MSSFNDLCAEKGVRCTNVGGRCYYMAVMTFLSKAAAELRKYGAVSPTMESVLAFAQEMTACTLEQQEQYCKKLPPVIDGIYQKYMRLSRNQITYDTSTGGVHSVFEGGWSCILLLACLSSAKGGFDWKSMDNPNRWKSIADPLTAETAKVVMCVEDTDLPWISVPDTTAAIRSLCEQWAAKASGARYKVLGGTLTLESIIRQQAHSVSFNVCGDIKTKGTIVVCDPNIDFCWNTLYRLTYFNKYDRIATVSMVAIALP